MPWTATITAVADFGPADLRLTLTITDGTEVRTQETTVPVAWANDQVRESLQDIIDDLAPSLAVAAATRPRLLGLSATQKPKAADGAL